MKFGKQLKELSVPEWQEYYMSYKRLKRIIKKLCLQLKEKQELQALNKKNNINNTGNTASPKLVPRNNITDSPKLTGESGKLMSGDARQEFFTVFESDIDKVNHFFTNKQAELKDKFEQLYSQSSEFIQDVHLSKSNSFNWMMHNISGDKSANDSISDSETGSALVQSRSFSSNTNYNINDESENELDNSNIDNNNTTINMEQLPLISPRYIDTNSTSITTNYTNPDEIPAQTLSNSQQKLLEERSNKLLELYREILQLLSYSELNFQGLRKIMKKFDKNAGESHQLEYITRMKREPFQQLNELNKLLHQTSDLYMKLNMVRGIDMHTSSNMLRNIVRDVKNPQDNTEKNNDTIFNKNAMWICISIILGLCIFYIPILPKDQPRAQKCLGLLVYITILWVTEAIPFFVASLTIPFIVIITGILGDPLTGQSLPAEIASRTAFGYMFNDTIMLILGGFSISAAFSKCQFELRLAAIIQRIFGSKPRLFLLAFMLLGSFLSMWISNVAAPVLLTSLLLPIVRDFGAKSRYARSLLLGLAISCNIGGMMSPISSPQNAIALGYLEQSNPDEVITFTQWLCISIPYCTISVIISWLYLVFVFLRGTTNANTIDTNINNTSTTDNINSNDEIPNIPTIVYEKTAMSRTHVITMLTSIITIFLWCSLSYSRPILGEMGTVAVLPVVLLFGSHILNKNDLTAFNWHLILLIGGGNVLGAAVNSSKLLNILSNAIAPYLLGDSLFVTSTAILLLVFFITTFVSHTVAALILTPLIVSIGVQAGHVKVILMIATLMMSGTMSLPMSSFPNINSLLVDDDFNRPFLHPPDYLTHGTAIAVMLLILLATFGFGACVAVFGST